MRKSKTYVIFTIMYVIKPTLIISMQEDIIKFNKNKQANANENKITFLHMPNEIKLKILSKLIKIEIKEKVANNNLTSEEYVMYIAKVIMSLRTTCNFFNNLLSYYINKRLSKSLKHYGINLNYKDSNQDTILILAIKKKNINLAKLLINAGANVNEKNNHGNTALTWAIFKGSIGIVQHLIDFGVNTNKEDTNFQIALALAEYFERYDILKLLKTQIVDQ